jgi:hypothetical protein
MGASCLVILKAANKDVRGDLRELFTAASLSAARIDDVRCISSYHWKDYWELGAK